MRVFVSAKLQLTFDKDLVATIKVYEKCLQYCVDIAWKNKIKNNVKLHPYVYFTLRKFGLPSQLAISCIKQACGIIKKAKSKPIIKKTSVRYNFPRSASLKGNILSLSTIKGRQKLEIKIPACYKQYFLWDISESILMVDRKGRIFFVFTFSKDIASNVQSKGRLGIDLGLNNLAVTSKADFFKAKKVKRIKRKFKYLRSKLQAKGTLSAKRLLKKVSGRERRFMAWVNHNISKTIVSDFNGNKIVMENLKGIRKISRGKRMNYWLSNWSFHQLQFFIEYKAKKKGIAVEKVKPYYTSKICHICGNIGLRTNKLFSCQRCGLKSFNADLNAARNLASANLAVLQAAVNQSHISDDDSKAHICEMKKNPEITIKSAA